MQGHNNPVHSWKEKYLLGNLERHNIIDRNWHTQREEMQPVSCNIYLKRAAGNCNIHYDSSPEIAVGTRLFLESGTSVENLK